jgi:hypothetical protein
VIHKELNRNDCDVDDEGEPFVQTSITKYHYRPKVFLNDSEEVCGVPMVYVSSMLHYTNDEGEVQEIKRGDLINNDFIFVAALQVCKRDDMDDIDGDDSLDHAICTSKKELLLESLPVVVAWNDHLNIYLTVSFAILDTRLRY